jgi:hypothetical protein
MNIISATWQYITDPANTFGEHTRVFLYFALWSIFWSIVIGVPLGIIAAQNRGIAIVTTLLSGASPCHPNDCLLWGGGGAPLLGLRPVRSLRHHRFDHPRHPAHPLEHHCRARRR